ncbi:hypothetical protein DFH27DRAFT_612640 [Peziza echinospora]|nr:hypothetical protein DFH27DRAFT_612640 [Peziza echinospora]
MTSVATSKPLDSLGKKPKPISRKNTQQIAKPATSKPEVQKPATPTTPEAENVKVPGTPKKKVVAKTAVTPARSLPLQSRNEDIFDIYSVSEFLKAHLKLKKGKNDWRSGLKTYWYNDIEKQLDDERAIADPGSLLNRALAIARYCYANDNHRFGVEQALGMSVLALYDLVILADNSASMRYFEGGARIEKLRFILQKITEIYTPASEVDRNSPANKKTGLRKKEGITHVKVLNGGPKCSLQKREGYEKVTPGKIKNLMADLQYEGLSELGTQLEKKILKPYISPLIDIDPAKPVRTPEEVRAVLRKPLLVIVITDGQIEGREDPTYLEELILRYRIELDNALPGGGANAVSYMFAQVGKDKEAEIYLDNLDNHEHIGDYVDCMGGQIDKMKELEEKGDESSRSEKNNMLNKLLLGAVDPALDEKDGPEEEMRGGGEALNDLKKKAEEELKNAKHLDAEDDIKDDDDEDENDDEGEDENNDEAADAPLVDEDDEGEAEAEEEEAEAEEEEEVEDGELPDDDDDDVV